MAGDWVLTINDDSNSDNGHVFSVRHGSAVPRDVKFTVAESGDVTVIEDVERAGTVTIFNTSTGDGDIVEFVSGTTTVGSIAYYSATGVRIATPAGTDGELAFRSGKDIVVIPDFDDDGAGDNEWFEVTSGTTSQGA